MAYTWFRVNADVVDHPKTLALRAELQEPLADAYVTRLWSWAHRYAPTGRINGAHTAQLETVLGWRGPAQALVGALEKTGWLERDLDSFQVHDWHDHQGVYVEKANRDADLKRKQRRQNGARTARAARSNGAQTPPAQDKTRQDKTNNTKQEELHVEQEARPGVVAEVFAHWVQETGRFKTALDDKRRGVVVRALKLFDAETLMMAISGYLKSPHHTGQNERHTKYLDLELMLRDAKHIEAGLEFFGDPPRAKDWRETQDHQNQETYINENGIEVYR